MKRLITSIIILMAGVVSVFAATETTVWSSTYNSCTFSLIITASSGVIKGNSYLNVYVANKPYNATFAQIATNKNIDDVRLVKYGHQYKSTGGQYWFYIQKPSKYINDWEYNSEYNEFRYYVNYYDAPTFNIYCYPTTITNDSYCKITYAKSTHTAGDRAGLICTGTYTKTVKVVVNNSNTVETFTNVLFPDKFSQGRDLTVTAGSQYYLDGTSYDATSGYTVKLRERYEVSYNANGGSGSMSVQERVWNDNVASSSNTFTRTGYVFKGWNTKADGTGTSYSNGTTATLPYDTSRKVTLYAQWTPITYTVSFDGNGGSGSMPSMTCTYDQEYTVPACAFYKENNDFAYWTCNSSSYIPSNKFKNLSSTQGASVTLKAQWNAKPVAYLNISRTDIADNESSIFTVKKGTSVVCTVIVTGSTNSRTILLDPGDYTVVESAWTWKQKTPSEKSVSLANGETKNLVFNGGSDATTVKSEKAVKDSFSK